MACVHIKEVAVKDLFRRARDIVEKELTIALHGNDYIPCNEFANPEVIVYTANRACYRHRLRPKDPTRLV